MKQNSDSQQVRQKIDSLNCQTLEPAQAVKNNIVETINSSIQFNEIKITDTQSICSNIFGGKDLKLSEQFNSCQPTKSQSSKQISQVVSELKSGPQQLALDFQEIQSTEVPIKNDLQIEINEKNIQLKKQNQSIESEDNYSKNQITSDRRDAIFQVPSSIMPKNIFSNPNQSKYQNEIKIFNNQELKQQCENLNLTKIKNLQCQNNQKKQCEEKHKKDKQINNIKQTDYKINERGTRNFQITSNFIQIHSQRKQICSYQKIQPKQCSQFQQYIKHSRQKTLLGLQKNFNDQIKIQHKNKISTLQSIEKRPNNSLNMPKLKNKFQKLFDPFFANSKNQCTTRAKDTKKSYLDETLSSQDMSENKTVNFSCNNFSSKSHQQIVYGKQKYLSFENSKLRLQKRDSLHHLVNEGISSTSKYSNSKFQKQFQPAHFKNISSQISSFQSQKSFQKNFSPKIIRQKRRDKQMLSQIIQKESKNVSGDIKGVQQKLNIGRNINIGGLYSDKKLQDKIQLIRGNKGIKKIIDISILESPKLDISSKKFNCQSSKEFNYSEKFVNKNQIVCSQKQIDFQNFTQQNRKMEKIFKKKIQDLQITSFIMTQENSKQKPKEQVSTCQTPQESVFKFFKEQKECLNQSRFNLKTKVIKQANDESATRSHAVKKEAIQVAKSKENPSEKLVTSQRKQIFGPQKPQGLKFEQIKAKTTVKYI